MRDCPRGVPCYKFGELRKVMVPDVSSKGGEDIDCFLRSFL
jgi:hypothetical protein